MSTTRQGDFLTTSSIRKRCFLDRTFTCFHPLGPRPPRFPHRSGRAGPAVPARLQARAQNQMGRPNVEPTRSSGWVCGPATQDLEMGTSANSSAEESRPRSQKECLSTQRTRSRIHTERHSVHM